MVVPISYKTLTLHSICKQVSCINFMLTYEMYKSDSLLKKIS